MAIAAQGRTISLYARVLLVPVAVVHVGHTDQAMEIGRGLMAEAVRLLKAAAEAEGFSVDVSTTVVVY